MLNAEQEDRLLIALFATAELTGNELSSQAAQMMVQDLSEYSEDEVTRALQACRRELTGKLTLAAILQRIHADDGRPNRDEAWAIAMQAADERDTVLLTGEIMAAREVARPILEARDKVGARMAFLDAYDRLVAKARRQSQPVKWVVSLGFDPDLRSRAIEQARDLGRLPAPEAERLLLQYQQSAPTANGSAIAGLLTGNSAQPSDEVTRRRLRAIRDDLQGRRRRRDVQARWDARKERMRLAALKQAAGELVQRHEGGPV